MQQPDLGSGNPLPMSGVDFTTRFSALSERGGCALTRRAQELVGLLPASKLLLAGYSSRFVPCRITC